MLSLNNRSIVVRMRLLIKLVFLFCLLTVVYQYSQCSNLFNPSKIESERDSINLPYSQLLKERRSVVTKKLAPYNSILGTASSTVPAYSNGNDSYYSNEDSYLHGVYMGLKWQCVEYARRWTFLRKSSIFESVTGANDMWNQLKSIERVSDKVEFPLKRHPNGSPNPPINESYLIYSVQKDMPYGHVAVIVQVLPNAIRIAEQNFHFYYWSHHYARQIPVTFKNGLYYIEDEYEVYGWMEIDDNKQLKPLDKTTIEKINMKNERLLNSAGSSQSNIHIHIYLYFLFLCFFVSHFVFF